MTTLLDLLTRIRSFGELEAARFCDGYRTRRLSYRRLSSGISAAVDRLDREGATRGQRLILYGRSAPAWLFTFWACVARGVEVVPVDFRSSPALLRRIQDQVRARWVIHGEPLRGEDLGATLISFEEVEALPEGGPFEHTPASTEDVVQILFTSGTTGDPKGAVHRHRNLCANLTPLEREIAPYLKALRPLRPLRILDLLPLSHTFGQSLGLYLPVLLQGSAVFSAENHPDALVEVCRRERVTVLASVPHNLENLRRLVKRRFPQASPASDPEGIPGLLTAAWRARRLHAAFGWKFWCFVVGGARVDPDLETFWASRGYMVVQGYGLTETSPVVAVNHPLRPRRGSLGKPIRGQEIHIAPDGEILVRGESVVSGYFGRAAGSEFEDGWFHTGDLGEVDDQGRLYFRGRKKDVIVTPEGMNVFPEDLEAALDGIPGIRESVVVPRGTERGEGIHAVLILSDPGADPQALVRSANESLEPHQRIQTWSVWPEAEFPRTAATRKVRRHEVAARVSGVAVPAPEMSTDLETLLARRAGRTPSTIGPETRLAEDLGMSSLGRVDLLSELEFRFGIGLDEDEFASLFTVGELKELVGRAGGYTGGEEEATLGRDRDLENTGGEDGHGPGIPASVTRAPPVAMPRWSRSLPVRAFRVIFHRAVMGPFFHTYVRVGAEGLEHLRSLSPPVLFAANHVSHFDTPAILAALPRGWRGRLSPAMAMEHFRAHLRPGGFPLGERLSQGVQYLVSAGLFSGFPLPRATGGAKHVLKYMGEIADRRGNLLVFPEGRRTVDGQMSPFQPGIGMMALRLGVPVVPVHLHGLFEVLPTHRRWPRPGRVRVRIGPPVDLRGTQDYEEAARRVEGAVRALAGA